MPMLAENFKHLLNRLGIENIKTNPPLDQDDESNWVHQFRQLAPDLVVPGSLLVLLRLHNGQTGMPVFSYFSLMDSELILSRRKWFQGNHPDLIPFAAGKAEDYLMIDGTKGESQGEIHYWQIESMASERIAISMEHLIQLSITGIGKLGEPNIDILEPMFAFDFPPLDTT